MDETDKELACCEAIWTIHDLVIVSLSQSAAELAKRLYDFFKLDCGYGKSEIRAAINEAVIRYVQQNGIPEPLMAELEKHTAERLLGEQQ